MSISFTYESVLDAPQSVVWAFHEREDAFEKLTPPDAPVKILSRSGEPLQVGSEVLIEIAPWPLKFYWLAHHTEYNPPHHFTDVQKKGPLRSWVHKHRFEPMGDKTRMIDEVALELKGGWVIECLLGWAVRIVLRRFFKQRHEALKWVDF